MSDTVKNLLKRIIDSGSLVNPILASEVKDLFKSLKSSPTMSERNNMIASELIRQASQENCDGEPWNTMHIAGEYIYDLLDDLAAARAEIDLFKNTLINDREAARAEYLELAADYNCVTQNAKGSTAEEIFAYFESITEQRDEARLIFSIAREWYAILEKGTIYDTTPELRDLLSILPNPPASEKI